MMQQVDELKYPHLLSFQPIYSENLTVVMKDGLYSSVNRKSCPAIFFIQKRKIVAELSLAIILSTEKMIPTTSSLTLLD